MYPLREPNMAIGKSPFLIVLTGKSMINGQSSEASVSI